MTLQNANPIIYTKKKKENDENNHKNYNEERTEFIDKNEIFTLIKGINDPEHPLTLEELNVVQLDLIFIDLVNGNVSCSSAVSAVVCLCSSVLIMY